MPDLTVGSVTGAVPIVPILPAMPFVPVATISLMPEPSALNRRLVYSD
jgi:hypothetical protein